MHVVKGVFTGCGWMWQGVVKGLVRRQHDAVSVLVGWCGAA